MAAVTYTTNQGTVITGNAFRSNSAFEILKAAVSLIERVEQAEAEGNAPEILAGIVSTDLGMSGKLFLTNNAEELNVTRDAVDQLSEPEYAQGISENTCPGCPQCQGDTLFDRVVDILSSEDGLAGEALADKLTELKAAYDILNDIIRDFQEYLDDPANADEGPVEMIGELGTAIREFGDRLPLDHPAAAAIFALGVGISLGMQILDDEYEQTDEPLVPAA